MENINYKFELSQIEAINTQPLKKRKNREQVQGYRIKVKAECDSSLLKALTYGDAPDFDEFFFEDDETLKGTLINKFVMARSISGHKLLIDFDLTKPEEMYFLNIHINSFDITPVFGSMYAVKFTILLEPNDEELIFLNHAVQKDNLKISIIEPPQLDFESDARRMQ